MIKSTVFKVHLTVADTRRNYYQDHQLTLARHPSETDVRMLMRIAVFALNAQERLEFTKGLSSTEEPDLWQMSLTGTIEHWIELGQPVEKRIRQSCSKADQVSIYTYQKGGGKLWFDGVKATVERFKHLAVMHLAVSDESEVTALVDRTMDLNCSISDDEILLGNGKTSFTVACTTLKQRFQR